VRVELKTSFFISRDLNGDVSHLVRICETEQALWGEFFQGGQWVESSAAMAYIMGGGAGEAVSEAEAEALARRLGDEAGAASEVGAAAAPALMRR
jgi:hypothetical protein